MGRIWMSQMVSTIADLGRQYFDRSGTNTVLEDARKLCHDLLSGRGEASGTALAREVVTLFREMEGADRVAFLQMLNVEHIGTSPFFSTHIQAIRVVSHSF